MLAKVKYSGKRLPWTISMPWLTVPGIVFGQDREAVIDLRDAKRLCEEAPTDFAIIGVIEDQKIEAAKTEIKVETLSIKPKKTAPANKRKPVKKE